MKKNRKRTVKRMEKYRMSFKFQLTRNLTQILLEGGDLNFARDHLVQVDAACAANMEMQRIIDAQDEKIAALEKGTETLGALTETFNEIKAYLKEFYPAAYANLNEHLNSLKANIVTPIHKVETVTEEVTLGGKTVIGTKEVAANGGSGGESKPPDLEAARRWEVERVHKGTAIGGDPGAHGALVLLPE